MKVGEAAPAFELEATDGTRHGFGGPAGEAQSDRRSGERRSHVIVFTCNHCPYALAWHDRLLAVARDYEGRARMLMINPNDAGRYPRDSFDAMKERVEADGGWPAPYLRDESQKVARAYGAAKTPDVFVLDGDGILRYRGAPDADYGDPSQDAAWLRAALDSVLDGRSPEPSETDPVGCSVKWLQ
jgi:hypothetical protein